MSRLRIFTDEDVYGGIPPALRDHGVDAVGTIEVGRSGATDESQLDWAAANNRAVLTFNVGHFAALHRARLATASHHAGIIVSSQCRIGELLRRVVRLAASRTAESMIDELIFLSDG